MARPSRYSPEVRERAIRMVREHGPEHPSQWAAIASIAGKLGCTTETLRRWVRQAERDTGQRSGLESHSRASIRDSRAPALSIAAARPSFCGKRPRILRRRNWCLSMRYTERLADAGIEPSVGSRGDSYDNALAESVIGLFKTEVIRRHGPWRSLDTVEFATLEWVDWFNHRRLLEPIGYVPPAEFEARYYEQAAVA
jgi:transposase InsO family protein